MRNRLFCICLLLPILSFADSEPSWPTNSSNLKISGYVDGSYNYLVRSHKFTSGVQDRVFDLDENGLTLQQAAITLANQPKCGVGGLLNIIVGRDANTIASYGWQPMFATQDLTLDITQIYGQYASRQLTLMGGKFVELAGAETIDPTQDTNFSRSILDGYAQPFTVTGFRGIYALNPKLKLTAGINDGWDNIRDFSRSKTIELNVTYTPNTIFSIAATGYSGGQRATDFTATGPIGRRDLIDVVATLNATDKLNFVLNGDYALQTKATLPNGTTARATWEGLAAYVNYQFNETWGTSLRGEVFYDQNGYRTGVRQNWREVTISLAYAPIKAFELRAETRHDFSNVNAFVLSNGFGANRNNQSYALEGMYKFTV